MRIEKLKSGSYRIRKMYKGETYTVVTNYKPTQKEAIQLLAAEMDKASVPKQHISFEKAAKDYIDIKINVLSPATVKGYLSVLKSITPKFKKMIITDISAADVQKEINTYSVGHSAKTVRNMHGFINAVLGMFVPNTVLNTTLPKYIKKEPYIPTDEDVKAVLNEARGTAYEIPLILAAFGLRRSEICALTMDDISDGVISISKAKVQDENKNWVIKETKTTNSTRVLSVPKEVTDKIKATGYIYKGHPNSIFVFLKNTQDRLGIPRFSLHKFRHYYASVCHSLNIPDVYIMMAGGWKTDNVLKNVYRHALSDRTAEMQQISNDYIKNLVI